MSAFALLPLSVCPPLQPGRSHSSHSQLSGSIHHIPQYRPFPPLFSSLSVPFTLIFHHSLQLPIPLFRVLQAQCVMEEGILLNYSCCHKM